MLGEDRLGWVPPSPLQGYFGRKSFCLMWLQAGGVCKIFDSKDLRAKYLFSKRCEVVLAGGVTGSGELRRCIKYRGLRVTDAPREFAGLARGFAVWGLDKDFLRFAFGLRLTVRSSESTLAGTRATSQTGARSVWQRVRADES